jgi:hypothetical protein
MALETPDPQTACPAIRHPGKDDAATAQDYLFGFDMQK